MTEERLKISIIIPIKDCNLEKLNICLDSIISQSYKNFEVIIKHNGPLEEYNKIKENIIDDRIVILNSIDYSLAEACNQAMNKSTGDLITIFAHDDTYLSRAFETLIQNVDRSMWYFGNINYYHHDKLVPTYYIPNPSMHHMRKNNMIPQPACFWRREVYDTIGPYDEAFKLCWDYDYWIRIMKVWPVKHISFTFADYFLNNNSISLKFPDLMEAEKTKIKEKHFHV
jgi:glycosyltransferase involved in cell wall biosynthesis